ncbi:hypothetical protein OSB04_un001121 [Centaurea solstitialis]|uniref:SWIM-type domain-containing protein n=1 Tax=Centaurea solstitialis TaxID=347529 RepID=A0AA38W2X2_9ASTR|nr:hypothetical protein OSB04_un001121 [Centaurea solstitialis]
MIIAVGQKFLEEHFEFKTKRSDRKRYEIVCAHDQCEWVMNAQFVGNGSMFMVRHLYDVHTCSRTQLNSTHRQANKKILGNILKSKFVNARRALTPNDIMDDIQETYGYTISYTTAWRARWKALMLIRGSHSESFTRLPTYLYNLERRNEGFGGRGTEKYEKKRENVKNAQSQHRSYLAIAKSSTWRRQVRLKRRPEFDLSVWRRQTSSLAIARWPLDRLKLVTLFIYDNYRIKTFLNNLRHVLIIDAAHLKGAYLGTMFLVVAMDGNNNIVPVAFRVGRSETADEWTWFLNRLKECIGEPRDLVFMSDRAASINATISAIFPIAYHALCCRHLVMNVRSRAPLIKTYKTPYWKACKAYTTLVFDRMMNILRVTVPAGAQLMEEVGVERWSRVHFPAQRFNIMTSKSAESINAMSRFSRELNHPLTEWAQLKIQKRIGKSAHWKVRGIGYGKWEVHDDERGAEVDIGTRNCSCRKWQVSGLPCGHAIAVAKKLRKKDVYNLITVPYYMTELYRATYQGVIYPVGPADTWESPEVPLPTVLPPLLIKRPVGRPKVHNRRTSRGESRSRKRCPRCEEYGHTSTQCPLIPYSARGSSQLEPIGTIDLNSLDQNVQFS